MHLNPALVLSAAFASIYLLLLTYLRSACWRDPTSSFYRPERAHLPSYSSYRINQAVQYADSLSVPQAAATPTAPTNNTPALCVGLASVSRNGSSYLKSTLGSMLQGLTETERDSLHVIVLLAHIDQARHPDHGQPWLRNMADQLPSYQQDPRRLATAEAMEGKSTHWIKSKFDYSFVLDECKRTGAPYILMIEDDVVFLDGWHHRTMKAVDRVASISESRRQDFIYLRLFYYEGLRGWNMDRWKKYAQACFMAELAVLALLFCLQRFSPVGRRLVTRTVVFLAMAVFVPLLIALLWAAGANCVAPQPSGLHVLSRDVCCGQGLVFPRAAVDPLLSAFAARQWDTIPTDTFIEERAEATGALRWVLTPVVMQHVGGLSSYGEQSSVVMSPSDTWNFAFELNSPARLAQEHFEATELGTV